MQGMAIRLVLRVGILEKHRATLLGHYFQADCGKGGAARDKEQQSEQGAGMLGEDIAERGVQSTRPLGEKALKLRRLVDGAAKVGADRTDEYACEEGDAPVLE